MKLETTIKPRKDGTVKVAVPSGGSYAFTPDSEGCLCCEVTDEKDVAYLVGLGDFYPTNEGDYEAALNMAKKSDGAEEGGDDGGEDEGSESAPPVETPRATPRAAVPKAAAKKKAAK